MVIKTKRGGKRNGSGRKTLPAKERIVQAWYFIQKKHLDKVGKKKARDIARDSVIKESVKMADALLNELSNQAK